MSHSKQMRTLSDRPSGRKTSSQLKKLSLWTNLLLLVMLLLLLPSTGIAQESTEGADTRPNIVLLVADDAGYSDFASFGGEALTPNIDALGTAGVKLTNFHVMPTCSPSRAVILTGVDNHLNGLGSMQGPVNSNPDGAQFGQIGYLGYLNKRAVTVATLLKEAGYHTYMVGKWHLGQEEDVHGGQAVFPRDWWPIDRGFEQSYGMLEGGGEHYGSCERAEGHCTRFFENDQIIIPTLPPDYFSAKAHTDKAIEYIDAGREADGDERKPFFLYYSDTLVHEPNQVPAEYIKQEYIDMYYEKGWDGMRADRLQRMKDLGLIPESLELRARDNGVPAWDDESDPAWQTLMDRVTNPLYAHMWDVETIDDLKRVLAKKFAVYTGMIEYFDNEVGRMVQHLQDIGEYENTVFIFFSDNGGDAREWDWIDRDYMSRRGVDNSYANIGARGSFVSNGPGWAQVTNTPFFSAKIVMGEAGIRTPMIVTYPAGNLQAGTTNDTILTVKDILPTVLDYAGVTHPVGVGVEPNWDSCTGTYNGAEGICPVNGKSLRGLVEGSVTQLHQNEPLGFELAGPPQHNKALYLEGEDGTLWKILRLGFLGWGAGVNEPWELYNLTVDPTESNDLSSENPEKLQEMMAMYSQYQQNVDFIPMNAKIVRDATAGTSVPHTFDITNNGESSDTFTLACHSDWACTLEQVSATNNRGNLSFELDAGASAQVRAIVSVPADAQDGQSEVTQVTVLRTNNPELSINLTAVTTVAGSPTSLNQTSFTGGTPISRDWLLAITTLLLVGAVLRLVQISGHTLWSRD